MKRIILLALVFVLVLTACSNWSVEIKDPQSREESGAQSGVSESGASQYYSEGENGSYETLLDNKDELVSVIAEIADAYREGKTPNPEWSCEELTEETGVSPEEIPEISSAEDFSVRKKLGADELNSGYAAVEINARYELRVSLLQVTNSDGSTYWRITNTEFAGRTVLGFYDWELSDIPAPKTYPSFVPPEGWKTEHIDWFGNEDPATVKYPNWNGLEVRNWADKSEYITISAAVPNVGSMEAEAPFGEIDFLGPERWILGGSSISWDGGFSEEFYDKYLKIGDYGFGKTEEIMNFEESDYTESDEVKIGSIKKTEKYTRIVDARYEQRQEPEIVRYYVNLKNGYSFCMDFYISAEVTSTDLEIYDGIVETVKYKQF